VQGLLSTQDFIVDSSQADISAKGSVHLVTMMADLRAVFKLPAGAVGGSFGDYFADEDGRPTVEAAIKGPLSDPTITPDLSRAAKKATEDLLKKGLEQGQKALEKFFKKK
ncbi:MAG: hypothetical protein HY548_06395, partial [Elusimicrobia bacterium]|nr:hypothetical protein [Elusimicrobiota bacterium]